MAVYTAVWIRLQRFWLQPQDLSRRPAYASPASSQPPIPRLPAALPPTTGGGGVERCCAAPPGDGAAPAASPVHPPRHSGSGVNGSHRLHRPRRGPAGGRCRGRCGRRPGAAYCPRVRRAHHLPQLRPCRLRLEGLGGQVWQVQEQGLLSLLVRAFPQISPWPRPPCTDPAIAPSGVLTTLSRHLDAPLARLSPDEKEIVWAVATWRLGLGLVMHDEQDMPVIIRATLHPAPFLCGIADVAAKQ